MSEPNAPSTRQRAASALPPRWHRRWTWAVAVALFAIAWQSAPDVFDFTDASTSWLQLSLVALAAAAPFMLILERPVLGWLTSATSAAVVSNALPVVDGDPWPWPVVHGLVLLGLLFWVAARGAVRSPRTTVIVIGFAWLATTMLFAASVPTDIRAGWIIGVTAVAGAGLAVRWLLPAATRAETMPEVATEPWSVGLARGFREAFVAWVPSPPQGRPLGERWFRNPGWLVWLRDALPWILAVATFALAMASLDDSLELHAVALPVLSAATALVVGLCGGWALVGWRLATVIAIVLSLVGTPVSQLQPEVSPVNPVDVNLGTWPVLLQWIWLLALFVTSVRHDRWTTIWVWGATVVVMSAGGVGAGATDDPGGAVLLASAATALAFVGDLIRTRRQATRALEAQTELSELEKARRTILEERTRIARDLHDIVAHHMSMVVVQAESAPYRLPGLSDEAKTELASISASARQALTEIRGLLGVLRNDDQQVQRAPQPGLDDLPELVATAARSGLAVTLRDARSAGAVPAATGLSAYRIVQESLANVARHAPGAPVQVEVEQADDELRIRVVNASPTLLVPAGGAISQRITPGHGIVGMRERAAVAGGTLTAERTPEGGFEVTAVLPLDPVAVPPEDKKSPQPSARTRGENDD